MTIERPNIVEINCTTGEVIERLYTDEEFDQYKIDIVSGEAQKAAEEAAAEALAALKASAKAKLVSGQPLTEEEAATLVI